MKTIFGKDTNGNHIIRARITMRVGVTDDELKELYNGEDEMPDWLLERFRNNGTIEKNDDSYIPWDWVEEEWINN